MGSPIALPEIYKAAFEDFVIPTYETAPFTTIQNRAMVTRSLKTIAGVERVVVNSINLLQNEFGPNGERVFEAGSKDSRIRYVGSWTSYAGTNGSVYGTIVTNDFLEVTFYGTGLNGLMGQDTSTRDWRVSVDGGSEGANIIVANLSAIIHARNYAANVIVPLASGLSLGWHTVKVRNANVNGLFVLGFEILNQRTDLAVYSGAGISNGNVQGLSVLSTSAFKAGVVGTRGARVVKYVQNGVVSQAVQEVDATSKYLTLTDHANEEVLRRINFREFGANRADDFSTLAGAQVNRAFTLDDGTTTLVGNIVYVNSERLALAQTGAFVTITFIGTGIDWIQFDTANGGNDTYNISIDGGATQALPSVGNLSIGLRNVKGVSGLPYGTHTLRLNRVGAVTWELNITDFIIYQPKKPSIPAGALEVADYNVMANYVANSVVSLESIPVGILRKQSNREFVYVGTFSSPAVAPNSYISGLTFFSTTIGNTITCRFFGTGFEARGFGGSINTLTINVDGSTNLSVFTTSSYGTGQAFTPATGTVVMTASPLSGGVSVSGLSLDWHTVIFTKTAGTSGMYIDCLDVITPIHINESNLKIGSQSLRSMTKYSPEKSVSNAGPDLSKAKAWVVFDGIQQKILSSYNVSAVLVTATGQGIVFLEKPFKNIYSVSGSMYSAVTPCFLLDVGSNPRKPHSYTFGTVDHAGTYRNCDIVSIVFFGETIDE